MLPEQTSAGRASGGTGGWRLEANLNRKANGLALEGPSVGLYLPLLEFNHTDAAAVHMVLQLGYFKAKRQFFNFYRFGALGIFYHFELLMKHPVINAGV
jgi:hypothetical protein